MSLLSVIWSFCPVLCGARTVYSIIMFGSYLQHLGHLGCVLVSELVVAEARLLLVQISWPWKGIVGEGIEATPVIYPSTQALFVLSYLLGARCEPLEWPSKLPCTASLEMCRVSQPFSSSSSISHTWNESPTPQLRLPSPKDLTTAVSASHGQWPKSSSFPR